MNKETLEKSAELIKILRKKLGSINIDDLKEPHYTDAEEMQRCNDAEIFYEKYMKPVLKSLEQEQLEWIGQKALNNDHLVFGRGTINGIYLIMDWFEKKVARSRSRFQTEEKPLPGEAP